MSTDVMKLYDWATPSGREEKGRAAPIREMAETLDETCRLDCNSIFHSPISVFGRFHNFANLSNRNLSFQIETFRLPNLSLSLFVCPTQCSHTAGSKSDPSEWLSPDTLSYKNVTITANDVFERRRSNQRFNDIVIAAAAEWDSFFLRCTLLLN